jgi:hypothetical protein
LFSLKVLPVQKISSLLKLQHSVGEVWALDAHPEDQNIFGKAD